MSLDHPAVKTIVEKLKAEAKEQNTIQRVSILQRKFRTDSASDAAKISKVMKFLREKGYITQVQSGYPALYDISRLFSVEVVEKDQTEETPAASIVSTQPKTEDQNDAIKSLSDNIEGFQNYLRNDLAKDFMNSIQSLVDRVKAAEATPEEIESLNNQINQLRNENMKLKGDLEAAQELLDESTAIDKDAIKRVSTRLSDEFERVITSPAWKIKQNEENFRLYFDHALNDLLHLVGVKVEQKVEG